MIEDHMLEERIELQFLKAKRNNIFETHGRMDSLIIKTKTTLDELPYLEKYQEFCRQQADDLESFFEAKRQVEYHIRGQTNE